MNPPTCSRQKPEEPEMVRQNKSVAAGVVRDPVVMSPRRQSVLLFHKPLDIRRPVWSLF
jgi:hypothetical protein